MKPFNLQEALNGAKVITRNGKEVIELHYFKELTTPYPVHFIVKEQKDLIITATEEGTYLQPESNKESDYDLFMAPVIKEGWINLYFDAIVQHVYVGGAVYKDEEFALRNNKGHKYISTIKIKWEE